MMLKLRDYQRHAAETAAIKLLDQQGYGLLLAPGLGKTAVSVTIANVLSTLDGAKRVLITSPSKVMTHWSREASLWNSQLPVYFITGNAKHRLLVAQSKKPGIYVVSHDNLYWLSKQKQHPYDLFLVDESSRFRNWSAQRTKAAKRFASNIPRRLILTGSPAPNCPSEFFAQQFILDRGATLGRTIGSFRDAYMFRGGFENRDWIFNETLEPQLTNSISPWYLRQEHLGNLQLPGVLHNEIRIDLPPDVRKAYKQLEQEMFAEFQGTSVLAFSGSQRYNLCRQLASGSCYVPDLLAAGKTTLPVHTAKIETLRDLLDESPTPVLVAYQYTHELHHIRQHLGAHHPAINGDTSNKETDAIILRWQQGKVPLLLCQSQAVSHGIDGLQLGGNTIVWFTLTNSPDVHNQLIFRLDRSGQKNPVIVHYLLCRSTIDTAMLNKLRKKLTREQALLEYLKEVDP